MENLISIDALSVDRLDETEDYEHSAMWKRLDPDASAAVAAIAHGAPNAALTSALSGTYRVVFPKGKSGVLKMAKDGRGFLPTLFDGNRFSANARLIPMESAAAMASAFNVLSILTAQHYLSEINHQLTDIQEKLDRVLTFLYTDKACELYAETKLVSGIFENFESIMRCQEQRTAAVVSMHRAKVVAEKNVQFYYRDMNRMTDSSALRDIHALRNDLENYLVALRLYGLCSVLEVTLSQNFDETYLESVRKDCREHVEAHNILLAKLGGKIEKMDKPGGFPIALPGADKDRKEADRLFEDIQKTLDRRAALRQYETVLSGMREDYTQRVEYRVSGDRVYMKVA